MKEQRTINRQEGRQFQVPLVYLVLISVSWGSERCNQLEYDVANSLPLERNSLTQTFGGQVVVNYNWTEGSGQEISLDC